MASQLPTLKHRNKACRDNYLRAIEFRDPEWIPCEMYFFPILWKKYRDALARLLERHPFIFGKNPGIPGDFDAMPKDHQPDYTHTDEWGVTWKSGPAGGFIGLPVGNPLADWKALDTYAFPRLGYQAWLAGRVRNWFVKRANQVAGAGADGLYDRLYFLRGFENLMRDMVTGDPHLPVLLQRFQDHQVAQVRNILRHKPDQVGFHTDIGGQDRLLLSPRLFRKYIKPVFSAIFQPIRQAGAHVYLHSDGHLLEIVDDLVECGVSVHDPQERANTIEGIEKHYKGKLCIDLDFDRQAIPFSSPEELDRRVKHAIDTLNAPEGGFMIKAEIADRNIPLENIEAICNAFEHYCVPRC